MKLGRQRAPNQALKVKDLPSLSQTVILVRARTPPILFTTLFSIYQDPCIVFSKTMNE